MKKSPLLILILGVLIAILAPVMLTIASHFKIFDFSNSGQIGDTIGGLTSPIINVVSAIIIYYSFNEQLKANQIQIKALDEERNRFNEEKEFNYISQLLMELERKIENFEYYNVIDRKSLMARINETKGNSMNDVTLYKGVNALILFAQHVEKSWNNYFKKADKISLMGLTYFPEFYFLINEVDYIIKEIENAKHLNQLSKNKLLDKF